MADKKERLPSWERRYIRNMMQERGIKYTEALRIFNKEKAEGYIHINMKVVDDG